MPPPRTPDDLTPPAVPRPNKRGRENTDLGGFGAPSPRISETGRYDLLARKLELERARERNEQRPPADSLPPPSMPLPVETARDEPRTSFRPGRDSIRAIAESVLRHAPRAAIGVALVVGVASWALGGPDGIAKVATAVWGSVYRDEITAARAEAKAAREDAAKLRSEWAAARAADRDDEVGFRQDAAEMWRKLGVDWQMPDGSPPRRPLEFVTPLRRPGVVKGGPSVVVRQPLPLPPPVPSSSP